MNNESELRADEHFALLYAKRMKEFYEFLITYIVLAVVFLVIFPGEAIVYIIFAGLGVALIFQGLVASEIVSFMSPDWERRVAERKLGRKL